MLTRHGARAVRAGAALALLGVLLWAPGPAVGQTIVGGEEARKYNESPLTVPVPPGLSAEDVEQVIVSTLERRNWTVTEHSPQQVVATLVHRGFDAKVILKVDGNLVKILNDSRYKSPTTGQLEPAIPKGWLKNLEKDLKTFLSTKAGRS
jgi:hypothetical protein